MRILIALISLFSVLSSCKNSQKTMEDTSLNSLSGIFELTQLADLETMDKVPYLNFDPSEGRVSGETGCNSFFGMYSVVGNNLFFRDIASTEMACEPAIMEVENKFLNALWQSGKASLLNNELVFYSKEDNSILFVAKQKSE